MINIKDFDSNLLKIDKKSYKNMKINENLWKLNSTQMIICLCINH